MILVSKNLVIGYENRVVLKDVNLEINEGDYVCLFGNNGAGKSTLVKTILGLIPKLKGEITFSKDISQRSIGYLPQHNDNHAQGSEDQTDAGTTVAKPRAYNFSKPGSFQMTTKLPNRARTKSRTIQTTPTRKGLDFSS